MAKQQKVFRCSHCDAQFPKWLGRCDECGKWGTVEEDAALSAPKTVKTQREEAIENVAAAKPVAFSDISLKDTKRASTGIAEVDNVLGGGIVPGSLMLLGGSPGIGKSTIVAQIASGITGNVLYVSGEESAQQIKMRMDRLGVEQSELQFLAEEHIEVICKTIQELKPACAIIDSIQTMASSAVDSEAGSVNQIKAATIRLMETAKSTGVPIIIIGHVTKGGDIGGPKLLEHMVDVVLYMEGDKQHRFRLLRSVKNRFGSTNEVGVFHMTGKGLEQVENPSAIFMAERSRASGSCVTAIVEGNRVFLLEVQALVSKTAFGYPQRKCSGYDLNRLHVLLGVLERRTGIAFDEHDVYINIVSGSQVKEPSIDLAVCAALVSSLLDVTLPEQLVMWGEVGLGGELRSVPFHDLRAKEAKRFGLQSVVSPKTHKTLQDALKEAGLLQ